MCLEYTNKRELEGAGSVFKNCDFIFLVRPDSVIDTVGVLHCTWKVKVNTIGVTSMHKA